MMRFFKYLILVIILFWGIGFFWFTTLIPNISNQDTSSADAIVVLTGGGLRLERGFELLIQKRATKIFVSGVEEGVTLNSLLHNKEYREFEGKFPSEEVKLGYKAHSTVGNAIEATEWIKKENIKSIILVTGTYHIPRSLHEFARLNPTLKIIPEPVFPKNFENNDWWQHYDSLKLVISEYNKYLLLYF